MWLLRTSAVGLWLSLRDIISSPSGAPGPGGFKVSGADGGMGLPPTFQARQVGEMVHGASLLINDLQSRLGDRYSFRRAGRGWSCSTARAAHLTLGRTGEHVTAFV